MGQNLEGKNMNDLNYKKALRPHLVIARNSMFSQVSEILCHREGVIKTLGSGVKDYLSTQ